MKLRVWLLALCGACTGGQTGVPVSSEMDGGVECAKPPDAASALGVTGEQLWDQLEGSYTFAASGSRLKDRELTWLDATSFEVTVTRTDEVVAGVHECGNVAAPVRVAVRSVQPALEVSVLGLLKGNLRQATLDFHAEGGGPTVDPGFQGGIFFDAGTATMLDLYTDEHTHWLSPIPERRNP